METHDLAAELQRSRDRIRRLLLPGAPPDGRDSDVFPRSAVMRFLFDSRRRRLAFGALTTILLVAARRRM